MLLIYYYILNKNIVFIKLSIIFLLVFSIYSNFFNLKIKTPSAFIKHKIPFNILSKTHLRT